MVTFVTQFNNRDCYVVTVSAKARVYDIETFKLCCEIPNTNILVQNDSDISF